jgi:hypothetical protein
MEAFDGVGGIDELSDVFGILKVGVEFMPIIFLGCNHSGIFLFPFSTQLHEFFFGQFLA